MKLGHHSSIGDIKQEAWDNCLKEHPLASHGWLSALEDSGSVCAEQGWQPHHLTLSDKNKLMACLPLYVKSYGRGEFIFDDDWAYALEQAGMRYYPKLLCAIPMTPSQGRRLLTHTPHMRHQLLTAALDTLDHHKELSSLHIAFPSKDECALLREAGFALKSHCQFHWHNRSFNDFDDFLASLRSAKRKQIRKERRIIADYADITLRTGNDMSETECAMVYQFYRSTTDRKWGGALLTRDFFRLIGTRMGKHILVWFAHHKKTRAPLGMALHVKSNNALYGRYWGGSLTDDIPYLHFELCYYRAMEYAIRHKLSLVEAGAQGTHKLLRGYEPTTLWSAHYFRNPHITRIIKESLENQEHQEIHQRLARFLPQKR